MKNKNLLFAALAGSLLFNACKKDVSTPPSITNLKFPYKDISLNSEQTIIVNRFKLASYVLSDILADLKTREELNQFILAKVKKTGNDESLTFRELFSNKKVKLEGVKSDFLLKFKEKFITSILENKFRHHKEFSLIKFNNETEILKYFGLQNSKAIQLNSNQTNSYNESTYLEELPIDPGFEIYFPYSENFENQNYQQKPTYAVTYNPLTNNEENEGEIFDYATGTYQYVSLIDDEFAYNVPTYIITIDDGLNYNDFAYDIPQFLNNVKYKIQLSDDDYNSITFESPQVSVTPPIENNQCLNRELRVRDGRWTLIRNGYGLFEGAIEFAVAFAADLNSVVNPNGNVNSNPLIDLKTQAWTYKKLKRKTVKKMINDENEYVNFNMNVSPWCPGNPNKMLFLYEWDKQTVFSSGAKEFSDGAAAALGLIGNEATKAAIAAVPLAPIIKVVLEGSSISRIEHYSILGSNEVYQNQRIGTAASNYPNGLFREFRAYGSSSVFVTLVID